MDRQVVVANVCICCTLVFMLVLTGCSDDRTIFERNRGLIEASQSLADRNASMEECKEALGDPFQIKEFEGLVVWRYQLDLPDDRQGVWLSLVFDAQSQSLRTSTVNHQTPVSKSTGS